MRGFKRWFAAVAAAAILPGLAVMAAPAQAAKVTLPLTPFNVASWDFEGYVDFELVGTTLETTFRNESPQPPALDTNSIARIYFEGGTNLFLSNPILTPGAGVDMAAGGNPPNLPAGGSLVPAFNTNDFRFTASSPPSQDGINPGEWLLISWTVVDGFDLDTYLAGVLGDGPRIGAHVLNCVDGESCSALVTPVPAALPLFITALAGLGFFGWRTRKNVA